MAIIKGAKNAEVVPPEQRGNLSWNKPAKGGLVPIKVDNKDKGRKKSFSKKTAQEAGAEYTKQKARNAANKGNKSKSPNLLRGVGKFHRGITGTNSAFSPASPNIIFTAGIGLVIASGVSSKRIPQIYRDALSPQDALAHDPQRLWRNLKITFVQVGFIFGITILSRMFPGISWFFLIVIGGTWLLWLMRNPELLFLLSEISQDGTTTATATPSNKLTAFDIQRLFPGFIAGTPDNSNVTPQLHQAITNAINSLNQNRK